MRAELAARRAQAERFHTREVREEPWLPSVNRARMAQILDHVHDYKGRTLDAHVRWLEEVLAELT
ncbi:hypothetical protein SNA_21035 [Streptomyces natalensis ATCC 27448]|uniref:Uncharacterized protein n=1 Tax=Streptomyces natalensis ATCC 27448 TaxID=1240678 RepID=A0A0D7CHS5_9ACTN|nr:hypothetical protein SNA_21035 [Streptomyces natalensis ATCC 27448]